MRPTEVTYICPLCRTTVKSKEWAAPNCDNESCNDRQMRKMPDDKDGVYSKQ